mgnify:FL=1
MEFKHGGYNNSMRPVFLYIEGSSVGELTGENHGANKKTSKVFDMTVTEDQLLIVTQSANSSIEYYQLHY